MTLTAFVLANSGWSEIDLISCALPNGVVMRATTGGRDIVGPDGFTYFTSLYGKWQRGGTTADLNVTTQCDVTIAVDNTFMLPGTTTPMLWVSKLFARSQVQVTTCTIDLAVPTVIIGSIIVFIGRCTAPNVTSTSLVLSCWDETYVLSEPWPRRVICAGCPFTLFDLQCRLDRNRFAVSCAVGAGSTQTNLVLGRPKNIVADSNGTGLTWSVNGNLPFSSIGGAVSGGVWKYTGTGAASGFQFVTSQTLTVTAGSTYTISGYIDATHVTAGNPTWLVFDPTITTNYASVAQTAGVNGRISVTFTVPGGVTQVKVLLDTSNCTVSNGTLLTFSNPQLELGSVATVYTASAPTTTLTLGSVGNNALPYSRGYIVPTSGQAKGWNITVTLQSDTSHLALQPFPLPIVAGDAFTLYPGCDGTKAVCVGTYNNLANNGSFPNVPGPNSAVNATGA